MEVAKLAGTGGKSSSSLSTLTAFRLLLRGTQRLEFVEYSFHFGLIFGVVRPWRATFLDQLDFV